MSLRLLDGFRRDFRELNDMTFHEGNGFVHFLYELKAEVDWCM